jgi:hypothetical protein
MDSNLDVGNLNHKKHHHILNRHQTHGTTMTILKTGLINLTEKFVI